MKRNVLIAGVIADVNAKIAGMWTPGSPDCERVGYVNAQTTNSRAIGRSHTQTLTTCKTMYAGAVERPAQSAG